MRVLVHDDHRDRLAVFRNIFPDCVTATSYAEAVSALEGPPFDAVWLDYDIGGSENGADVAFWMTQMPLEERPGSVFVPSWSIAGALAIFQTLKNAGFVVERRRYPP